MRVLLLTPDEIWAETLDTELRPKGIEFEACATAQAAVDALQAQPAGHFDALLMSAFPVPGIAELDVIFESVKALGALRGTAVACPPTVVCSRIADARLAMLLNADDGLQVTMTRDDTPAAVKAVLVARLSIQDLPLAAAPNGTPAPVVPAPAPPQQLPQYCPVVEVDVGTNEVQLRVIAGGKQITEISHSFGGRTKVKRLEDKFRNFDVWDKAGTYPKLKVEWQSACMESGTDLAEELALTGEEFRREIKKCLASIGATKPVHYRFNIQADPAEGDLRYAHVPFELVYDDVAKDFLRAVSPVARRLRMNGSWAQPVAPAGMQARPIATRSFSGPVLFVHADARGQVATPTVSFDGQHTLILGSLHAPTLELACLQRMASPGRLLPPLHLQTGQNAVALLQQALQTHKPEILHFAGHSVRADDDEVYLVLPGTNPGEIWPLAVRDLAPWLRLAGVHLVILSSCESASPLAMLRLAREDVPAAIGFRWEVEDDEAATFTCKLHEGLVASQPLARAFHEAVCHIRTHSYPGSPTFASAMLVVQEDDWVA